MTDGNLQDHLDRFPDVIRALRAVPNMELEPTEHFRLEYTNWRSEQQSWHDGVALFDLSHHMIDVDVQGAGALGALRRISVNGLDPFPVDTAKQFIATTEEGYVVGDGILQREGEERFRLIGDAGVTSWAQYHLEQADDVRIAVDPPGAVSPEGPQLYRYQVQGPNALALVERAIGGPVPPVRFFHLAEIEIAGHRVRVLRHGMAGRPGFELTGPWGEHEEVRAALLAAGRGLGVVEVGWLAYFTCCLEGGWLPVELPAFYHGESSRAFREWHPAEPTSLGGSFDSERVEDYLFTPYELGYGAFVDLDHDFIGRDALALVATRPPARAKVTLELDGGDVADVFRQLLDPGTSPPPQPYRLNNADFALNQDDAVLKDGRTIGFIVEAAYVAPFRRVLALGVVDAESAEPGTEVTVLWGDSLTIPRSDVEEHRQVPIRATVAPTPYGRYAREAYRR